MADVRHRVWLWRLARLGLLGLLVAGGAALRAATVEALGEPVTLGEPNANLKLGCRWDPALGLFFRAGGVAGQPDLFLTLKPTGSRLLVGTDTATATPLAAAQLWPERLPAARLPEVEVLLKVRDEGWWLYVRGEPVARFRPPFALPAQLWSAADQTPADAPPPRQQKIAPFRFATDFMVDDKEKAPLAAWESVGGEWGLRTAQAEALRIKSPGIIAQRPLRPDFSPNFYNLQGRGTGLLLTGYGFEDDYTLQAAMETGQGALGLVFAYRDANNYYTFGIEPVAPRAETAVLKLQRYSSTRLPRVAVLGAVEVPLTAGQWVMLRVSLCTDAIVCQLDQVTVLEVAEDLPPGGRFGVCVRSPEFRQFDDISAASRRTLDLRNAREVRFHQVGGQGSFFPTPGFWDLLAGRRPAGLDTPELRPPAADQARWLALGSVRHEPHVFGVDVTPQDRAWSAGLLVGYRGADQPHFRYTCTRAGDHEVLRLEAVPPNADAITLAEYRQYTRGRDPTATVRLAADATIPGCLRLYYEGTLVLLHHAAPASLGGAAGLYVGPRSRVAFSELTYTAAAADPYRNQFEKNRVFVTDPFMRHWSSPEGEWYTEKGRNLTWYKSDCFGALSLRLPVVSGSEAHLGVDEGQTDGALILACAVLPTPPGAPAQVRLSLQRGADRQPVAAGELPPAALAPANVLAGNEPAYAVHYEGHWVWVTAGPSDAAGWPSTAGQLVFQYRLPRPLSGTRLRVAGYPTAQLAHCFVHRDHIKDVLFKEAPAEWTVNGGQWTVTNRFQCEPKWSHMTGEAAESMAALWTKYEFRGDFCAEMYVGARHGWYQRVGDANLTIMNAANSPALGYTVTCTGWDPDHSQLLTRLFRQGVVVAETDKFAMPRWRDNNLRHVVDPLIAAGRDVHGAWYCVKLRRHGRQLEYFFDNERLLAWEDPNPLDLGSFGVWTYRNSLVVARVKIAAEEIRPRAIACRPAAAAPTPLAAPLPADADLEPERVVRLGERPLELGLPEHWTADDPVSRAALEWHRDPEGNAPYFLVRSVLGSGSLAAACRLPPLPFGEVAGFRFLVKRTLRANFNFHFSLGRQVGEKYEPERQYYYQLAAEDFSRGDWQRVGGRDLPAEAPSTADELAAAPWTAVTVWLPTRDVAARLEDPSLRVQIAGFGCLQPSDYQQGLRGNDPGQAYAIRDFSVIRLARPRLTLAPEVPRPLSFVLTDPTRDQRVLARTTQLAEIQAALDRAERDGLNRFRLRTLVRGNRVADAELLWIRPPPEPDRVVQWAADQPAAVRITSPSQDRRLARATLFCGATPLPLQEREPGERVAWLPRPLPATAGSLPLRLVIGTQSYAHDLRLADRPQVPPPVLVRLDGLTPLFANFETRQPEPRLEAANWRLVHGDPEQGTALEIYNTGGHDQRLPASFNAAVPLARYPLLQFRYRSVRSAQFSLQLPPLRVRFNEPNATAAPVRFAPPVQPDGRWHTWTGAVADAPFATAAPTGGLPVPSLQFLSVGHLNQTGRYAYWQLDDLVFGPAVSRDADLAFTPHYEDADGQPAATVYYALHAGPASYHELSAAARTALAHPWLPIAKGAPCTPALAALPDGLAHLWLKATDQAGRESAVTDIPFLLDRRTLEPLGSFTTLADPTGNGTVATIIVPNPASGAPLDTSQCRATFRGQPVTLAGPLSFQQHTATEDRLQLNWPYLLRGQLEAVPEGDGSDFVIANLRTGAGVGAPQIVLPIVCNRAADRQPPTYLPVQFPANFHVTMSWRGRADTPTFLSPQPRNTIEVVRHPTEGDYLNTKSDEPTGRLILPLTWKPKTHPFLALQVRLLAPRGTTQISLKLVTTPDNRTYTIPLSPTPVTEQTLLPPQRPAWEPNRWVPLIINVQALFAAKLGTSADVTVSQLSFERTPDAKNLPLHLKDLCIFAPWTEADTVRVEAYDASGMNGLEWEYVQGDQVLKSGAQADPALTPLTLGLTLESEGWLRVYPKDLAGNRAVPLCLPVPAVPSSAAPGAAPAPVEETK